MNSVFWAALAIGGSTLMGTGCGFLLGRISDRGNEKVTAFAAGVMLAAAAFGLFVPAAELAEGWGILMLALGAIGGALFLKFAEGLSERMHGGEMLKKHPELLFVLAIAVHKFPEGMAGGVGLRSMNPAAAVTVVVGIALQNLPEGAVMIPPLLNAGAGRGRAACIALATGLLNAAGVLAGALWGFLPGAAMPLALAFAGGAMMQVILARMLCRNRYAWISLAGFLIMACVNAAF